MSASVLRVGFVPLLDMAPLAIAHELGFARAEGLNLELRAAPSWSSLRDMLLWGQIDAAHMLAPLPVAMALGLGGAVAQVDILQNLSLNGVVVAVSLGLADAMRARGHGFGFDDARTTAADLARVAQGVLRIGVPFPFSTQAALVGRWLRETPLRYELCTVPPPRMADALGKGEIDAYCVGEPWGSMAVETGAGALVLPGKSIWAAAPEKVLAARHDWIEAHPDLTRALMRAVWKAGKWMDDPDNRETACALLGRAEYVNAPSELLDRILRGEMIVSPRGELRHTPQIIRFHQDAASFPWRSQAAWFAADLAQRHDLPVGPAIDAAQAIARTDLYRENLRDLGADLPGASAKLEGAISAPMTVASERGTMILPPDRFFDGHIFDSAACV
ncbi:MAG: nitrate transporter [Rhodobacteraceae bacterium]|nr:MAG: nitrate transporter [Paracoccaceae bacterium]